ncbi:MULTISPECIES: hypothetical protein [unclassified Campylobacter]|uniref:hypothetical protein n=1 Tax=unclassified Campylobacter TaxID=2593542 RepID=UPI003D347D69
MNRVKFIQEALNANQTQALIISELIKPLKDEDLVPFFAFRASFIQPMQSAELITKNAVYAYRKQKTLQAIRAGEFRFKSVDGVVNFVREYFKNERLCYGAASFKDFVIIGVDAHGNLINHYAINQNTGKPKQLSSGEEYEVYSWLYEKQERIGVVKFIAQKEREQIEQKTEQTPALPLDPDAPLKITDEARAKLATMLGNWRAK